MIDQSNAIAALGDPTRRRIFELIAVQPRRVGALARIVPISQPAISQHLKVLKAARLVRVQPDGASNIYFIDPHGLAAMRAWLDGMWDAALGAFSKEIEAKEEN